MCTSGGGHHIKQDLQLLVWWECGRACNRAETIDVTKHPNHCFHSIHFTTDTVCKRTLMHFLNNGIVWTSAGVRKVTGNRIPTASTAVARFSIVEERQAILFFANTECCASYLQKRRMRGNICTTASMARYEAGEMTFHAQNTVVVAKQQNRQRDLFCSTPCWQNALTTKAYLCLDAAGVRIGREPHRDHMPAVRGLVVPTKLNCEQPHRQGSTHMNHAHTGKSGDEYTHPLQQSSRTQVVVNFEVQVLALHTHATHVAVVHYHGYLRAECNAMTRAAQGSYEVSTSHAIRGGTARTPFCVQKGDGSRTHTCHRRIAQARETCCEPHGADVVDAAETPQSLASSHSERTFLTAPRRSNVMEPSVWGPQMAHQSA